MNIAILGAGYVGLTAAAVFARIGHAVWLVDTSEEKIEKLLSGEIHFFEPRLAEIVKQAVEKGRLIPTTAYEKSVRKVRAILICVGTPPRPNGTADLSQVFSAAAELSKHIKRYTIIVIKSTVPIGTAEKVKKIIQKRVPKRLFDIASCPEFLREGSAVQDTLHPDRIIIGTDSRHAQKILLELHKKLSGERVFTDLRTAELIKYASNAFLATKISFINEIANLCEVVKANVDDVALGMGLDPRIGKAFLRAGIGYGGSCFPKDTRALNRVSIAHRYHFRLLKTVIEVNREQRKNFLKKLAPVLGKLKGKRIGVLGLAFKNNTDDVRESAAIEIIRELIKKGAKITAFDPKAGKNAKTALADLKITEKPEEVARDADGILILTEWSVFQKINWPYMKKKMRSPIIIDGRNLLDPKRMRALGFIYHSMGRP